MNNFFLCRWVPALVACLAVGARADVDRRTPIVEAVSRTLPTVVNIGTERLVQVRYEDPWRRFRGDLFDQFFGEYFGESSPGYRVAHSLGSGVIVDPRGLILTNYHVIERATAIRVTLADEKTYTGQFVAGDEINDLALIRIRAAEPLPAIRFADGADLMLGETVIALGNPFGLSHTVTAGVLSAKDREARYQGQVLFRDILQTDAAVNPGSSGGPLLNINGELIGINVAIYREAQNIGFAVPVTRAAALMAKWLSPRELNRIDLACDLREETNRVTVASIVEGGAAAKAGLKTGDRVLAVDGHPVARLLDIDRALLDAQAGDVVRLAIDREGRGMDVSYALAAVPEPSGEELARDRLGLVLGEPAARSGYFRYGLFVKDVVPGSPAERGGLTPGLIMLRIKDRAIRDIDDVGEVLESVQPGDPVGLVVVNVQERGSMVTARTATVQLTANGTASKP